MPKIKRNLKFPCYKCDGSGKILGFSHVAAGTCFACGGSGERFGRLPKGHVPCQDCREVTPKQYQETLFIQVRESLPGIGRISRGSEIVVCVGCAAERQANKDAKAALYCAHPRCHRPLAKCDGKHQTQAERDLAAKLTPQVVPAQAHQETH